MINRIGRLPLALLCCLSLVPLAAEAQVAPGVTQSAAHTANISGVVKRSDGSPVANANVKLSGQGVFATQSDNRGIFSFRSIPWGIYQITVYSSLGTASRNSVDVNGDLDVAIQYPASSQGGLKTIAEVSTTGAGAHINITATTVSSVTPSAYAFDGNGTWTQMFSQIPGVAVSGFTAGGANFANIPYSPLAPVVLSLNGALPYETQTTLDGMPLQNVSQTDTFSAGGGTDLSNMPLNSFDTADVVRGPGANAPSIVDSIGGSFVLHPPGVVNDSHFEYSVSNDPYGGIVSNAKVALNMGRLSATLIYGVNDSPGPLGTTGVISADAYTPATINNKPVAGNTNNFGSPQPPGVPNCYCTETNTLLYCCTYSSTAWTAQSGAASIAYKVTPHLVAEVFYAGQTSRQNGQLGYVPVSFAPDKTSPGYSGSIAPSPAGVANYLFLRSDGSELQHQSGNLLEEKVTAYVGSGVFRFAAVQNNSFLSTAYPEYAPNGQYRVWGTAPIGASSSSATPMAYNGTLEHLTFPNQSLDLNTWMNNRDFTASYAVQADANSTAGVSYTQSYYNNPYFYNFYNNNQFISFGSQTTETSTTTGETRVHFDTTIADKLSLGLSWYYADGIYHVPSVAGKGIFANISFPYSAPRLGAVWRPSSNIAIRAAAGGGFALPLLQSMSGFRLSYSNGAYYEVAANPNLKPETSFGFDLGSDVRLNHDTVLSADIYRTRLYGQFFQTTNLASLNGKPLYLTQEGNIGTSVMEGVNIDAHRDVSKGYYWRGTLGFTRGYVTSLPAGFYSSTGGYPPKPCTNCVNQGVLIGPNFTSATFSAAVPYSSASGLLGYKWAPERFFDLSSTYYGPNNIYNTPKAFLVLNAHAGYAFTRNVSLLATFNNITGAYDQSIQTLTPAWATPVVSGASGYYNGATFTVPYGPRTVIVTANFKV